MQSQTRLHVEANELTCGQAGVYTMRKMSFNAVTNAFTRGGKHTVAERGMPVGEATAHDVSVPSQHHCNDVVAPSQHHGSRPLSCSLRESMCSCAPPPSHTPCKYKRILLLR